MAGTAIDEINKCINDKTNFLLSGGAGSGKTYTLIQTLHHVFKNNPKARVACITYTNVAVKEIKERSPYSRLRVSTIHDFLWDQIKGYQKNLKQAVLDLISAEESCKGSGLEHSSENEINEQSFTHVAYQDHRDLEHGVISHDDLLKTANYMFSEYPLLSKILCDKYDYIFIDEYQDTQESVVEIFLKHIKNPAKNTLCVGFFGDSMQSIYGNGVGDIEKYVKSGDVSEILKEDNYRCGVSVIELLNRIHSDIKQEPASRNTDGTTANKPGNAIFIHSKDEFDLSAFQASAFAAGWNFDEFSETKVLLLTHKLSAAQLGFAELLSAYKYSDNLIGNEPDRLARHLLKIGSILFYYQEKNFAYVINEIQRKIKTNADKQHISATLSRLSGNLNMSSIEEVVNEFDRERFVRKDARFIKFLENDAETYDKIKALRADQLIACFKYCNKFSPFSTQHGVKGAEFNNVLVVTDNGKWNKYNFKHYFEDTPGKESMIKRTKKIFYVCCSRAKENLIVYYPNPTNKVISKAKQLFGEDNVHNIDEPQKNEVYAL